MDIQDAGVAQMPQTAALTCPGCGHIQHAEMPDDACVFFYACQGCGALHKPKTGDCCVFCSYGDKPCPPLQAEGCGTGRCT